MTLDLFDGGPPIHGFLLGAIAFYQGTILGRRKVHGMGFTQSLASKIGILLSVLRVLWYGPGARSGFHSGCERCTAVMLRRGTLSCRGHKMVLSC